jgi:hypothetical protein
MKSKLKDRDMNMAIATPVDSDRFARCITASKRVRWDIDADVIRGRNFDIAHKFLPDGLTLLNDAAFLSGPETRFLSQIQGRTYANMFGLVERFIDAKILEVTRDHWLGDQTALEALVRFSDEELKHQELFRRVEALIAEVMPAGYAFAWDANAIGSAVLSKSTWAVLGLTLLIELFTQVHYRESIEPDDDLSPLFKDVFLFHWKEESQHAILDELEWRRIDAGTTPESRDAAVDELIGLVGAVDGILRGQASADCDYFEMRCGRLLSATEDASLRKLLLDAYRTQSILSGAQHAGFIRVLNSLVTPDQSQRIAAAIATLR